MDIVAVGPADDPVLIDHYFSIWESYGTPPEDYADDARANVASFIEESRARGGHGGFFAIIEGEIAGSIMCCLLRSPYPEVIKQDRRLRGYIWSVYTAPGHRRKGVGRMLTERAISHLKAAGCTSVVLHASDAGAPLYQNLGFRAAHECDWTFEAKGAAVQPSLRLLRCGGSFGAGCCSKVRRRPCRSLKVQLFRSPWNEAAKLCVLGLPVERSRQGR